jgi:hypothetical protein
VPDEAVVVANLALLVSTDFFPKYMSIFAGTSFFSVVVAAVVEISSIFLFLPFDEVLTGDKGSFVGCF